MGAPEPTHLDETAPPPPPPARPGGAAPGTAPSPAAGRLDRLALLPLPVLALTLGVLWIADPPGVYTAPGLLALLNLAFATLVSFLVAFLGVRGFLVRGDPGLLLLACGAEIWGMGGLLAPVAGWSHVNATVTVHNACALLSGGCHLAAVVAARRRLPPIRRVDGIASTALGLGVAVPALVAGATLERLTPVFFVQGRGGTPVGDVVLGAAVVLFVAAAALLGTSRGAGSRFRRFYALALAVLALGLAGVMVQPSFGGLLGWAARGTQYAGGAYMLVAAIVAVRETKGWALSLEAGLADAESRLRSREARLHAFFENLRE